MGWSWRDNYLGDEGGPSHWDFTKEYCRTFRKRKPTRWEVAIPQLSLTHRSPTKLRAQSLRKASKIIKNQLSRSWPAIVGPDIPHRLLGFGSLTITITHAEDVGFRKANTGSKTFWNHKTKSSTKGCRRKWKFKRACKCIDIMILNK